MNNFNLIFPGQGSQTVGMGLDLYQNHKKAKEVFDEVDDTLMGCSRPQGSQGKNIARQCAMAAGLPVTTPAMTVDRQCSSGMMAIGMMFLSASFIRGTRTLVSQSAFERLRFESLKRYSSSRRRLSSAARSCSPDGHTLLLTKKCCPLILIVGILAFS